MHLLLKDKPILAVNENGQCSYWIRQDGDEKYELEEFLPRYFMRISKSTILNTNKVYSIQRNLTASSVIEFQNTHKQIYVSRYYYKPLKNKLEEKRKLT